MRCNNDMHKALIFFISFIMTNKWLNMTKNNKTLLINMSLHKKTVTQIAQNE